MLGVLVEPMLLLGLWVAAQVAGSTQHQQHHRHRLSLPLSPEHPAGTGALCLCVRHL
ncbi:formate hydrogenlyase subunit 4 [Escherichia coli]|uniref:Formate hydrogenlyase subunit 4 n=1 Tax=Escherichia coli TaxID=562 RepID=A0A2X3JC09_ECOLX|nr:formate hydrogenlyase subunit 4 [Escherichia coli]